MNNNDINIDERIHKVCQNAENDYSQSNKNNLKNILSIENGISSINNNYMTFNKYNSINNFNNSDVNNEFNERKSGLNDSYSKIAKINNKSIDTDANVLSKIKFGVKNEKDNISKNTIISYLFLMILFCIYLILINI